MALTLLTAKAAYGKDVTTTVLNAWLATLGTITNVYGWTAVDAGSNLMIYTLLYD